jgi:transcriptional regulator with XRE-family HTH domain
MQYENRLGKYLLRKRLDKNLTQHRLAQLLGLKSGQFISNYERGLCSVPLKKVKVMLKILKLDPIEVINLIQEERFAYLYQELVSNKSKKNA